MAIAEEFLFKHLESVREAALCGACNEDIAEHIESVISHYNSLEQRNTPTEEQRSCFTCKNQSICFVYRDIMNSTKEIGVNIDGKDAPGKWSEVFCAMGNCCLKFKKWEESSK